MEKTTKTMIRNRGYECIECENKICSTNLEDDTVCLKSTQNQILFFSKGEMLPCGTSVDSFLQECRTPPSPLHFSAIEVIEKLKIQNLTLTQTYLLLEALAFAFAETVPCSLCPAEELCETLEGNVACIPLILQKIMEMEQKEEVWPK